LTVTMCRCWVTASPEYSQCKGKRKTGQGEIPGRRKEQNV